VIRYRGANPDWTRDELIVALNVYLQHRPHPPPKASKEINALSMTLNRLGEKLFRPSTRAESFRNPNGVYMHLMNFRRLDPDYTASGKKGLTRGAKGDEDVWAEFAGDPERCKEVSDAIVASLDDPEVGEPGTDGDFDHDVEEAPEGRLLTRKHIARERNRKLVLNKRKQALEKYGKLTCEACGFDFAARYGKRGEGFIECHHTKPVASFAKEHKTHINDLAIVCANCHRVIHRGKPWLSIAEVRAIYKG